MVNPCDGVGDCHWCQATETQAQIGGDYFHFISESECFYSSQALKWSISKRIFRVYTAFGIPFYGSQATAVFENIAAIPTDWFGNCNGSQAAAAIESMIANIYNRVADGHRFQSAAIVESSTVNHIDGVGNCDWSQAAATFESPAANLRDGIGDVDWCQSAAARESIITNRSDGVGDNSVFTTYDQFVIARINNGVTIISRVIFFVSRFNNNRC